MLAKRRLQSRCFEDAHLQNNSEQTISRHVVFHETKNTEKNAAFVQVLQKERKNAQIAGKEFS